MCVIREVAFSGRHSCYFQIERMPLRQIERGRIATKRFRNSFEIRGVLSAGRLPRLFFDLVDVYFAHTVWSGERTRPRVRAIAPPQSRTFLQSSFSEGRSCSARAPNTACEARALPNLFLPVEVIGLHSSHDHFLQFLVDHSPLAAVGIKTGITGSPAAARIISDHVINKIFVTGISDLMRFARLKEKRVARTYDCRSVLVANTAAA